ncbi:hypothetical protein JCM10908_006150 [Rhodotorula pacifica]|uniref:t-SNARE syntaxin TLG2 n=1 Tax=Rhodotorula pacifica TaxID=1495444 RepID=UPI0031795495
MQPVTRSRTSLFLSYRESRVGPTPLTPRYLDDDDYDLDSEETGLIAGADPRSRGLSTPALGRGARQGNAKRSSGAANKAKGHLPPEWVDWADRVDEIVLKIKPKMVQLDKLHAKHLLPGFKDRSAEEREIEALATSITADFRTCQAHIRRIAEQSQSLLANRPRDPVEAEMKRIDLIMAANVQTALATRVQELSTTFRKKQADYLRQLKGNESRAVEMQTKAAYDPLFALADDEQTSRNALAPGTPSLAQQQLFAPSTLEATDAIDRRNAEIHSIAQSIADLADMFKDLSSLVIDQGTLLDRVDWNVEQMNTEVKGAVEELTQATRYQRRSGKCQFIFLLILLVIGCVIILTLRPPKRLFPVSSSDTTGSSSDGDSTGDHIATNEELAQKISEELNGRQLDAQAEMIVSPRRRSRTNQPSRPIRRRLLLSRSPP